MSDYILVCDDEPHITRSIEMKLSKAGFRVVTAGDGQAGLEQALLDPPRAVISDLQMPRMNGLELCEQLRGRPETREIPLILLTAKAFELDEQALRERLGLCAVAVKPFSPRELLQLLQQSLADSLGISS